MNTTELDQLRADHAKLVAECAAVKQVLKEVGETMICNYDGNPQFLSAFEKSDAALSTPTGQELLEDKALLDWLDSPEGSIQPVMQYIRKQGEAGNVVTYRQAIDAARSREGVRG
jgi:hypothetical protein